MLPHYELRSKDILVIHKPLGISYPPHMHKYIEILYINSGVQNISVNNVPYSVGEGDSAIIFPNILHDYSRTEDQTADITILLCEPKVLGGYFPVFDTHIPINPVLPKKLIHNDVVSAIKSISEDDEFTVKIGWLYIIISHLLLNTELKPEQIIPVQDIIYKIINYISLNFKQQITLDSIAKDLNISKYYIPHIFSERFKMSFKAYLGLIRLDYAVNLIRTSNQTLTSISIDSGFECQRTFNRTFRSVYGTSPSEYRINFLKNSSSDLTKPSKNGQG